MFKKLIVLSLLLPTFTWAAPSPETVLTGNCLSSYQKKYKTFKKHKAFVYAREEKTGKSRCQWQSGSSNPEAAKKSVIDACAKHQLNAECIIVDVDDEYLVKDGDFSLVTPVNKSPMSASEKESLIAEANKLLLGNCIDYYKKHLKDKEHRVFAYSLDPDGKYACGKSYGASMKAVELSGLKACKRNKLKRGKNKPKSDCRVLSANRKVLLNADDYGITLSPKSDKSLSAEEIKNYLGASKHVINEGPCYFQLKYYLNGSQHQAFYLATDAEGKQTCGKAEGAFSPEIANQKALKNCQNNVKKNNLKANCELLAENFEFTFMDHNLANPTKKEEVKYIGLSKNTEEIKKPKEVKKAIEQPALTPDEAFQEAIYEGDIEKIKQYIEKGLDVNIKTKEGVNPLFIAAARGDEVFFKKLLDKGADIKNKTKDGNDILIAATLGKNIEIVRYVLEQGFDVNTQGREGYTALHFATINTNKELISLLIDKGADASIKNDEGISAAELAKKLKIDLK